MYTASRSTRTPIIIEASIISGCASISSSPAYRDRAGSTPVARVFARKQHGQPYDGIQRAGRLPLRSGPDVPIARTWVSRRSTWGAVPQRGEYIGLLHDLGRQIGVQIQACDDRNLVADRPRARGRPGRAPRRQRPPPTSIAPCRSRYTPSSGNARRRTIHPSPLPWTRTPPGGPAHAGWRLRDQRWRPFDVVERLPGDGRP